MAYEEINPSIWTYSIDGDFIEGFLVDVKKDVGENKAILYGLQTERGVTSVWGSAILDSRMSFVQIGDKVKITFKGLGEAKAGRNAPKIFKVEIDRE